MSSASFSSRSAGSEGRFQGGVHIHDIPLRRNTAQDYAYSSSSRTGGKDPRREGGDVTSPDKCHGAGAREKRGAEVQAAKPSKKNRGGTFTRRARKHGHITPQENSQVPQGTKNRKRGMKQVWMPVPVQVVGDENSGSSGKRQRIGSVF
jgi:hypothetical protein